MHKLTNNIFRTVIAACVLTTIASSFAIADVTYLGTAGVKDIIFLPANCGGCHDGTVPERPVLDNYDDAADNIAGILVQIESGLMPPSGPLTPDQILLMQGWSDDGVPERSVPQLSVTGHSTLMSDSADLEGTLQENGQETSAYFRYWQESQTEPTTCPSSNSIYSGCTTNTSPAGTGGGDIDETITSNASGLNCATTYKFRAVSEFNGQFFTQTSPGTMSFTTDTAADADLDLICDAVDNCPVIANSEQLNTDGDAEGDACDLDDDNDGIEDTLDNCPIDANPGQEDANDNGIGDVCESDEILCFPVQSANGKTAIICL